MIDAKQLLDQFLGAGAADRLSQQAGGMLARTGRPGAPSVPSAGSRGDFAQTAGDLLRRHGPGFAAGSATTALAGLLLGSKGSKKMAKNALKLGGLAALGGIAYKAYTDYQSGRPVLGGALDGVMGQPRASGPATAADIQPAPVGSGFEPQAQDPMMLVRAMIAAAKADGVIDEAERKAILGELERAGLDEESRGFLEGELANPAAPEALAAQARTPQQAAELYTAALLAIDADTPQERAWVARLAVALKLDPQLAGHIEAAALQARQG